MRKTALITLLMLSITLRAAEFGGFSIEDIVSDIYHELAESGEVDQEQLMEELLDIAASPIHLNTAREEDLLRLRFLSEAQIEDILLFVHREPLHSLSELSLIPSLHDYEIRSLMPFVSVGEVEAASSVSAREVFRNAHHELLARVDARNIESAISDRKVSDPFYTSLRYRFHYGNRFSAAFTLRRPVGGGAKDLQYGGYIELHDLWRFRSIVAGNYQAHFGQGLVVSSPFHMGKSMYVLNAGSAPEGLRKYASTDHQSFHGAGATIRAHELVDVTAFYSLTRPNDSIRKHTIGANLSVHYQRLRVGATALYNIYSDSLRYYYEHAAYNQNYFRGARQAVMGAYARYNWGIVDLFGEVAAAQNQQWGWAATVGSRITPTSDIGLLLLYRYYSPTYDNTWGYSFSETSRINDENGLYLGIDIRRLRNWRFAAYGDIFRFSGIKYGIPYAPSLGYDAQADITYYHTPWQMNLRLRAREKARKGTYSLRYRYEWESSGWKLRTQADANLVADSTRHLSYGVSLSQDVQYAFAAVPITLQLRAQAFDARAWDNRIYLHENDVLHAFSIPATYGLGGRLYLNFRYRIIPALSLYLKVSETIYEKNWAVAHSRATTQTDIHLLLRATL